MNDLIASHIATGLQVSTDSRGAQVLQVVTDVRAVSKEFTLSLYLTDSESDSEDSPVHKHVLIPGTEAESRAPSDLTELSQTTEQQGSFAQASIVESTPLTRKRSQYKVNNNYSYCVLDT